MFSVLLRILDFFMMSFNVIIICFVCYSYAVVVWRYIYLGLYNNNHNLLQANKQTNILLYKYLFGHPLWVLLTNLNLCSISKLFLFSYLFWFKCSSINPVFSFLEQIEAACIVADLKFVACVFFFNEFYLKTKFIHSPIRLFYWQI